MLQNREGQRVPNVTFPVREGNTWKSSRPTTSSRTRRSWSFASRRFHADLLVDSPAALQRTGARVLPEGVDSIVCVSVNDTFVMNEWAKDQESANITLLPDGNGAFTEGMGMLVDKSDLGFGKRSWRYPCWSRTAWCRRCSSSRKGRRSFEVSDADTMLAYFAPKAARSPTRWSCSPPGCPFCVEAKALLQDKGFDPIEIPLENKVRGRVIGAVSQGHRAAGVHQRLADRRPGRPEGALRPTGIRHAGPGRPGMPRGSAPCVVEPARRIPAARVPARPRPGAAGTVASRARAARRIRPRQDTAQPRHIGSTWI